MEEAGVLKVFAGIAVHDCWKPYWHFKGITHATCNVHLLRELKGIRENNPEQTWPIKFTDLLIEGLNTVKKAKETGRYSLQDEYLQQYSIRYDEIMELAHEENPYPEPPPGKKRGRKKKGKILSLIERLEEYKASVCLFLKIFDVPFAKNIPYVDNMLEIKGLGIRTIVGI